MSSKRLLINIVSNIVSFIVSMGISFLLTPYITNTIGKEAYGFVGLANNFVNYAQLITIAINSLAMRFITIKIHEKNINEANKYFTTIILANVILAIMISIPASYIVLFLEKFVQVPNNILNDVQILWGLVFLNFLISIITSTFSISTFATNRLDLSALRSIESNILRVVILIILFSIFSPNVYYVGIASIICTLFIFIADMKYKKKLLPDIKINIKQFDMKIIGELLKSGIWNVITKLGQILSDGLDLLITNLFIDASAMGILAIAKTVPTAVINLLITVSNVFSPQLTIYYAKNEIDKVVSELEKSMKISGIFSNISMSILIALGYSFYSLWVPGENISLIQTLSILTVLSVMVSGVINSLFSVFTVTNKLKVNSCVTLGMGLINAFLVFILLKFTDLGILAVAGVSSITSIVKNLTFTPIYASKCLNISYKTFYPTIIRYMFSSIIIIISNILVSFIIKPYSWITLILSGIICLFIGVILNYLLIFNKNEKQFIKESLIKKRNKILVN